MSERVAPRRRTHALELTLASTDDAMVRDRWQQLEALGLPSAARHQGATHRPHVTVHGGPVPDSDVLAAAAAWSALLPLELPVAGHVVLSGGRWAVVAELLVAPAEVLRLRAELAARWTDADPRPWVPHLTLLPRATPEQAGRAVAALGPPPPARTVTGLRWWDPDAGQVTRLAGAT